MDYENHHSGNVYIADGNNKRVRKVNAITGIITTVVGNGVATSSGDGGPATNASLLTAQSVFFAASGDLYVVDGPSRVRKVNSAGIISTVAGNGMFGFSGDGGPATSAEISPYNIAVTGEGDIYLTDLAGARIRKVDAATGIINTIAGTGIAAYNGDGISCLAANIGPYDVKLDNYGNIFIADAINDRVRMIDHAGIITTVAGIVSAGFSGNNGMATAAQLSHPEGVGFDSCGNVYIADSWNRRVRKVSYTLCHHTLDIEAAEYDAKQEVAVYPSPVYSDLHIDHLTGSGAYSVQNMTGQAVLKGSLTKGNNTIGLQQLPAGMYLLELTDEQGNRTVTKIIKQ